MLYRAIKSHLAAKGFFNEPHSRRVCSGEAEQRQESSGKERTVGLLLVLLVALMTCVFSAMGTAEVTLHKQRKEQRQ